MADSKNVCAAHGLRYDPTIHAGCVLCRRKESRSRVRVVIVALLGLSSSAGAMAFLLHAGSNDETVKSAALAAPATSIGAPTDDAGPAGAGHAPPRSGRPHFLVPRPGLDTFDPPVDFRRIEAYVSACESGDAASCTNVGSFCGIASNVGRGIAALQEACRKGPEPLFEKACAGDDWKGCTKLSRGRWPIARMRALMESECDRGITDGCVGILNHLRNDTAPDEIYAISSYLTDLDRCRRPDASDCSSVSGWRERAVVERARLVEKARDEMEAQASGCERGAASECARAAKALSAPDLKDDSRAAAMFKRGCDLGDPGACMELAQRQGHGVGVARDEQAALASDQRAHGLIVGGCVGDAGTEIGCLAAVAMEKSGQMQMRRAGLAPKTLQRECEAGQEKSCIELANVTGGVESPWRARGVAILRRKCDNGDAHACGHIGLLERAHPSPGAARHQGVVDLEKACRGGDASQCLAAMGMYERGEGAPRDLGRARELERIYLEKARAGCDQGNSRACVALGVALGDRPGGKEHLEKGRELMMREHVGR